MNTKTTFKEVWTSLGKSEKEDLAEALETSTNTLSQAAHGHFLVSRRFAKLIEFELGKENLFPVTRIAA